MLQKIRLRPGLDKQSSDTGAEGKWVNGDYMRFRYSFPEKNRRLAAAGIQKYCRSGKRFAYLGRSCRQ